MNRMTLACLAILGLAGCATPIDWAATGGSRADGTVKLSYEHSDFQTPQLSESQAVSLASRRCQTWGYTGAEAFGGVTRQCAQGGGFGACARWMVTKEYQCTGTGTHAAQLIGPPASAQAPAQVAPVVSGATTVSPPVERDPAKRCDTCGSLKVP